LKRLKIPDFKRIQQYVVHHPLLKKLENWAKSHSLPGFFKVPIYDVFFFVLNELRRYDLTTRANSIAFSFFLSLFPSLLALFTTLPWIKNYFLRYIPQGENFEDVLETEIFKIMPGVAGERLFQFVDDITSRTRFDLLSFGFLMAIYFASNGMIALMGGFEKSYMETFKRRSGWRKRFIAIALTFSVGFFLISAVILIILGQFFIKWLVSMAAIDRLSEFLLNGLRWLTIIVSFYIAIAIIYRYGIPTRRRFKIFTPGGLLATLLCILTSIFFSTYVNNFNTYNTLYGSIGAIIVLMLWIQFNSLFLLIGFELNASIAINRDLKAMLPKPSNDL
jgi:membrane protein